MEWVSKIIETGKIPIKFIFIIFISSLLILFLPQDILSKIKLDEFINKYGLYIGITTIISGTMFVIELSSISLSWYHKKSNKNKQKKIINSRLKRLDHNEKSVLREFYLQDKNTLELTTDNPIVAGLINAKILNYVSRNGQHTMIGSMFPLKISENILSILNLSDIDIPIGNQLTKNEENFLNNNRPNFIKATMNNKYLLRR